MPFYGGSVFARDAALRAAGIEPNMSDSEDEDVQHMYSRSSESGESDDSDSEAENVLAGEQVCEKIRKFGFAR
jgi:hypothetical protein